LRTLSSVKTAEAEMAKSLKKRQAYSVGVKRVSSDRAVVGVKNLETINKLYYESKNV
jgi:hypothetical protein